jgi:hypothetical protein
VVEINGNDQLIVKGSLTVAAGQLNISSTGTLKTTVNGSVEASITGDNTINAKNHIFGPTPVSPSVLGDELIKWLATHTHPGLSTPPAQGPTLSKIVTSKFRIPK